jgi:hypothetical protein
MKTPLQDIKMNFTRPDDVITRPDDVIACPSINIAMTGHAKDTIKRKGRKVISVLCVNLALFALK